MTLSRRRFLSIAAGALVPTFAGAETFHRRTGRALGAATSLKLVGTDAGEAEATFAAVEAELARLERIFSLYDPHSSLSALNAAGHLKHPPPELLEVLSHCAALNQATEGAFDPTIQPLWAHHAGLNPAKDAGDLVGWQHVRVDHRRIAFTKPGMQLTLNGIAQGYITDRIATLLRARGLTRVMIDMGEIAGLGLNAQNRPWKAGVATPDGEILARVQLTDRALATSASHGMMLNAGTKMGHILDPLTGEAPKPRTVAVSSPSAMIADGLSTAGCILPKPRLLNAINTFPETQLEAFA